MVQVTDVKLPIRTRDRLEAENNIQRVLKPHDIRTSIPMVDYTNPAKFPPYVFREYPKMPLLDRNRPIVINDSGDVLIFYDAADEVEFKDMNPEIADEIDRNTPAKAIANVIAAQAEELESLRAKLRAAGIDDGSAKKKPANALAALVGGSAAPVEAKPTEESLAAQITAAEQQGAMTGQEAPLIKPKANPLKKK